MDATEQSVALGMNVADATALAADVLRNQRDALAELVNILADTIGFTLHSEDTELRQVKRKLNVASSRPIKRNGEMIQQVGDSLLNYADTIISESAVTLGQLRPDTVSTNTVTGQPLLEDDVLTALANYAASIGYNQLATTKFVNTYAGGVWYDVSPPELATWSEFVAKWINPVPQPEPTPTPLPTPEQTPTPISNDGECEDFKDYFFNPDTIPCIPHGPNTGGRMLAGWPLAGKEDTGRPYELFEMPDRFIGYGQVIGEATGWTLSCGGLSAKPTVYVNNSWDSGTQAPGVWLNRDGKLSDTPIAMTWHEAVYRAMTATLDCVSQPTAIESPEQEPYQPAPDIECCDNPVDLDMPLAWRFSRHANDYRFRSASYAGVPQAANVNSVADLIRLRLDTEAAIDAKRQDAGQGSINAFIESSGTAWQKALLNPPKVEADQGVIEDDKPVFEFNPEEVM